MSEINQPHSAEYLGEHRNYWWNDDFLELMAKRWGVDHVFSALDVGCGLGHWGEALSKYLPSEAKITGIDYEEEWVKLAAEKMGKYNGKFDFKIGNAQCIPFENNTFDLVTCQTVLLHVHEPVKALSEMVRVLKPGGLLIVAEPNNSIAELVFDSVSIQEPIEDIINSIRFNLICEKGQHTLGQGFSSLGDLIPGYLTEMGLKGLKVYQSDKACPLFPPYEGIEQQLYIRQLEDWFHNDLMIWDISQTKKYFLAGGGEEEDFAAGWELLRRRTFARIKAISSKTYSASGGSLLYLISALKSAH